MAHLALYRKFRPATFDAIVRQEHVVRVLVNQIERREVGHAYLFTGPRGTGKTSVARIFARAINCEHPVNGSPCGKCETCLALAGGSLDIVEIDAASNNGVNEMRDLREKVQYPPVSCRYKVYIIDEVHMLTDSAFNALLKTLEEPPAHAVFILATTEPHKIPATILSRCMRLDFKLIPEEDLEKHLAGILDEMGRAYEPEAVAAIARAGAGSDRDMLSIAEMCLAYGDKLTYAGVTNVLGAADFSTNAAIVSAMLSADLGGTLSAAERVLGEGKGVGVVLRDLLELLNRVAVAKSCPNAEKLLSLPKEMFSAIKRISDGADGASILRATDILVSVETELRFASSPRISLETALLRIAMPREDRDTDALLARIAALERRVAELSSGAPRAAAAQPAPSVAVDARGKKESAPAASDPAPHEMSATEKEFGEAYVFDELPPPPEPDWGAPPWEGASFASKPDASSKRAAKASVQNKAADDPFSKGVSESVPAAAALSGSAAVNGDDSPEVVFGKFLRRLRKLPKSGVVYTLCRDLAASREGDTLVLTTDVRTVADTLNGERHAPIMREVFAEMGVEKFEVRYASEERRDEKAGLEQLKKDFSDYPIDIK